ncbi:sugar transferase [Asticcacaulis sp. DXS10W]|uniref:Sugar transferase n=1 Tax=Asticcacaulis currens TaxID=2984210 RepID=A0ABT5I9A7_9CAUL|nr:sugar transferase [Asticcacaulis currens]MDC7692761.1 sugar transferase [Asticcacaulis currens]
MKYETQAAVAFSDVPLSHEPKIKRKAVTRPKQTASDLAIRLSDIIISAFTILFLLPSLLFVAMLVKLQDGGPAIYGQRRIGLNGREFRCLKFRSMHVNSDEILAKLLLEDREARAEWQADHKLRNDPRITGLGRFLRKSSIDELPQLFNVLRGEMSLVGPRPIVRSEVCKYGSSFDHYTSVVPGITGLWQVLGRNDVTYRRRVALDRLYSQRRTLKLYFQIIFMTVPAVLFQRGSY